MFQLGRKKTSLGTPETRSSEQHTFKAAKNLYRMQAAQAFPGITFISLNAVDALSWCPLLDKGAEVGSSIQNKNAVM